MLADPAGAIAKLLPFWSTRELGTFAVDGAGQEYLERALVHAGLTFAVLSAAALALSSIRLRLVALPEPRPDDDVA